LTSAALRGRLPSADAGLDASLGAAEAAVLRDADQERLARLARFLGRHFYRERIVRLFAASRALAQARGADPLAVLDGPEFRTLLDVAEVGSAETADRVAVLVEDRAHPALRELPWGRDLVRYEGTLFRVEAGPRRWAARAGPGGGAPARSPHARVVSLDWDVTALVLAVRRGATPSDPAPAAARLLVALDPEGRVTTLRCPDGVARLLDACDGARPVPEVARAAGVGEAEAAQALDRLASVGAVTWS
jgi:hypothetical protein